MMRCCKGRWMGCVTAADDEKIVKIWYCETCGFVYKEEL